MALKSMENLTSASSKQTLNLPQTNIVNRSIVLNSRPIGVPTAVNFKLQEDTVPTPSEGQVLLRALYLSLDPYMRGRMSDAPSYVPPVALDAVMVGSTISIVETSLNVDFKLGDFVLSSNGWQEYALSDGKYLVKINASKLDKTTLKPSLSLGMPEIGRAHV